jgi:hypothetical protein
MRADGFAIKKHRELADLIDRAMLLYKGYLK